MSSEPSPTSHNKDTNTSIQLSAVPSMSTSRTATAALVPPSPGARARHHHHEHDDDDNDEPLHRQFTSIESMVMSVAETMSDADSPTLGERFNDALFSQTPGLTLVALFGGLFFLPVIVFVSAEVVPFFRDWDAFSDVVGAHWFLVAAAACTCMSATLMYDARMITLQGYDEPQQFNSHEWVAACNVQGVEGRLSHRSSLLLLLVRLVAHAGATYLQFIKENEGDVTVGVVGDTLSGLYMLAESAVAGVVAAESPLLHWLTHPRYAVTPKMYAMVLPCGSHPLHSTCRWLMSQFLLAPLSIPLTLLVALPLQLVLSVPELVRFLFVDLPFRLLCDCARRHCGLCTYLLLAPFIVLGVVLALARVFIGLASAVFVIPLGLLLAGGSLVRSDSFSRSIPSAVMTVSIAATIYYDGGVAALVVGLNSTPNEQLVVLFAVLAGFCISPLLEPQSRTFSLRPISVLTRFTHPAMFMSSLGYVVWANELFTQLIGLPISLAAWFHMFPPGGVSLRIFAFIFGAPPQNVKPEPVSEFRKKRLMLALVHAQSNSEPEATEWLLEQYADILDTSVVEWTAQQCFEYELEHSPVGGKTFLDLSSSDDDAVRQTKRLVGLLKNNTFVETLFVHDVADEELAAVLAETIRVNRTINLLGLFLKQDELAPALLEAVQDNTGVQSLLLFPPGNDDHWVAQLLQLLRRNKHVKKLSVSGISDAQQQVVRDAWAETGRDPERLELK